MNNNDLKVKDFLVECHVAVADLDNLAASLIRSVKAIEYDTAYPHPDRVLIETLSARIKELEYRIGDRI
jgi:hypothetical protein